MVGILESAVIAISAAANPQQEGDLKPLRMRVDKSGLATVVELVGTANNECSVSYELQVTQNGNRSVQRGVVRLRAGAPAIVATVRLAPRPLTARLIAKPCGAVEYQDVFDPRVR